jgi:5'-3' exonuclease
MKVYLVFDLNCILYEQAYVVKRNMLADNNFPSKKSEKLALIKGVASVIYGAISTFSNSLNVIPIFFQDNNSWRKKVDGASFYKSNRESKDDEFDRNELYKTFNTIFNVLADSYNALKIDDMEGDDLIHVWCREFSQDAITIIYTIDKDLYQLVGLGGKHIGVYNRIKGEPTFIFSKNSLDAFYQEDSSQGMSLMDSFGVDSFSESTYQSIRSVLSTGKISYVSPEDVITEKIFVGDKSDNVPSVITKLSKTGNVVFGFTSKKVETLKSKYGVLNLKFPTAEELLDSADERNLVAKLICEVMDVENDLVDSVVDNILLNLELMYLSDKTLPSYLYQESLLKMKSFEDKSFNRISVDRWFNLFGISSSEDYHLR